MNSISKVESVFDVHWMCWKFLGQVPPQRYKLLYNIYSLVLNIAVTIGYPLHLLLGLALTKSNYDIFKILAISLPCVVCSIKSLTIWYNLKRVQKIEQLIQKLNQRIQTAEEFHYYERNVAPAVKMILHLFYFLCFGSPLTSEIAVIVNGLLKEWRLMYPAYFPFDAYCSGLSYTAAHLYQILGVTVQCVQNLVNDTYGGIRLVILAGQMRLLGMRIARIGYVTDSTLAQSNDELLACIQDHKCLLEYYNLLADIITWGMFVQIIFTGLNMCVVIIYMVFYMDGMFSLIYYVIFLIAVILEMAPCCYYGSVLELEFEKITYAIFKCNWMQQSRAFKQNLRLFVEQTLKPKFLTAGSMFRINLGTFFAVCRGAYSLFAVIMRMK